MQPTYFASFLLGSQEKKSNIRLEKITPILENWIFKNKNRKVERPENFDILSGNTYNLPNNSSIQTRHVISDGFNYFSLRYEHEDNLRRHWRTDIVLDSQGEVNRCSIGVYVGSKDGAITPLGDTASRPAIVPKLIKEFGAHEAQPLVTTPLPVTLSDVLIFVQLLESKDRHIPVLLVTPDEYTGEYKVDRKKIADQLSGIAYVVYAENNEVTYEIRDEIGYEMNAYNGAVRLYWPGFSKKDSPYRHPLWIKEIISEINLKKGGFAQFILRDLAKISATRYVDGVTRWEDVLRKKIKVDALSANSESDLRALLELALEDIHEQKSKADSLRSELDEKNAIIDEKTNELDSKIIECNEWRNAWEDLKKSQNEEIQKNDEPILLKINNSNDAIAAAFDQYNDRVDIISSGIRKESSYFERPIELFKAIRWIATGYFDAKIGKNPCPNLELSCRTESGMFYRPHQSKNTMARFENDYKIIRNGKSNWLQEHIGVGTGTDPRKNIRIAFYFDKAEEKVIIGFIGQHQETTASN